MPFIVRAFTALAPDETARERALPLTLLVRPWPVFALVVLALNDHVLKGSGLLPSVVTGKLSDFAGLFYFPLLLVTLVNLTSTTLARAMRRSELPLMGATTAQLAVASSATTLVFTLIKVSRDARDVYARIVATLQWWHDAPSVSVVVDPSDLIALPMCALAFVFGRRMIARMPPGRLPMARARVQSTRDVAMSDDERVASLGLTDVKCANHAGKRPVIDALARAIVEGEETKIDAHLRQLRMSATTTEQTNVSSPQVQG
jgi:hypothetical protein